MLKLKNRYALINVPNASEALFSEGQFYLCNCGGGLFYVHHSGDMWEVNREGKQEWLRFESYWEMEMCLALEHGISLRHTIVLAGGFKW